MFRGNGNKGGFCCGWGWDSAIWWGCKFKALLLSDPTTLEVLLLSTQWDYLILSISNCWLCACYYNLEFFSFNDSAIPTNSFFSPMNKLTIFYNSATFSTTDDLSNFFINYSYYLFFVYNRLISDYSYAKTFYFLLYKFFNFSLMSLFFYYRLSFIKSTLSLTILAYKDCLFMNY